LSTPTLLPFHHTAPTDIHTLSLHDALPIFTARPAEDSVDLLARIRRQFDDSAQLKLKAHDALADPIARATEIMVKCLLANGKILDRKSTRLNSSHEWISYAVFCLKKKNKK